MKFLFVFFSIFLFSFKGHSQDLKEFQHIIFCTPIKSELINSLIISRLQEQTDVYPYSLERIKFKLVFADYVEVKATNEGDDQIRIRSQNKSTLLEVTSAYFPIKFYTPNSIWQSIEHMQTFKGLLVQGRYDIGKNVIELSCQSRLSKMMSF